MTNNRDFRRAAQLSEWCNRLGVSDKGLSFKSAHESAQYSATPTRLCVWLLFEWALFYYFFFLIQSLQEVDYETLYSHQILCQSFDCGWVVLCRAGSCVFVDVAKLNNSSARGIGCSRLSALPNVPCQMPHWSYVWWRVCHVRAQKQGGDQTESFPTHYSWDKTFQICSWGK